MGFFESISETLSRLAAYFGSSQKQLAFSGVVFLDLQQNPERAIGANKLVMIGPAERPKWLRFRCPCGCKSTIALNLMQSHSPRWSADLHEDGTITVYPSVHSTSCGSHFWIRQSIVTWADVQLQHAN